MPNFKKMYTIVCIAASDAIDSIHHGYTDDAVHKLQNALYQAEDLYIDSSLIPQFSHACRKIWKGMLAVVPYALILVLLFFLLLFVFFLGSLVGLHGWFLYA